MIQLSAAGKRYGEKLLFENLDWLVTPQDRIGVVGANGTGKSTLLKILGGLETVDYGTITAARGITFGYLPQEGLALAGRTVFDECMSVFTELLGIEQELHALAAKISELDPASGEYAEAAERYHRLDHEFGARDGYAIESQAGTVLAGLGFKKEDWQRRTEEFSGGWQMRIALAKLLLQRPNLLLLDEPTNHLDLESRNWLEEYLQAYPHAYVLISHDRYFLDVTVKKIVEIWNRRVHFYPGNYDKYLAQKTQRLEQLTAAYKNQRERIAQLEAFITRFRYQATKAKQVQSRIKELERMERVEIPPEEKTIHFRFPQPKPSGRVVAELVGVEKSYGEKLVLRDVNLTIERGDRIALVGVNGAGKSTLIRLLAGLEPVTQGERRPGHKVEADYFAQDQYKQLDPEMRVLDDLEKLAPRATQTELRSLLGSFLFTEADVFKRIGVLSGGERNRYALARMLMYPSNFLLLDEPTNHLDLRAKDVLLEALAKFSGTVVFVSHDRYFIDKLATKVFEVAEQRVTVFPGNYEDFRWRKEQALQRASAAEAASSAGRNGAAKSASLQSKAGPLEETTVKDDQNETESAEQASPAESRPTTGAPQKRLNPIKLRQMQERLQELEEEVSRVEAEIAECEKGLETFVSPEETARLAGLLERRRSELEALMGEWEELSSAIEGNV
ncbi:MAG: ribosomal protection-like ABC-F family protein [Terriglobales bacterium]